MKRVSHTVYSTAFNVAYLALAVNAMLAVMSLPFLILLVTTDPSLSWPLLAASAALTGPGIAASFATFRAHAEGDTDVIRSFIRGVRRTWKRALVISAVTSAVVTVALVDVFVLVPTGIGVLLVPLLVVVAILTLATAAVTLVAITQVEDTRLLVLVRASLVLSVRRWPMTFASFAIVAVQAAVLTAAPAIAIGLTTAACLYVVWAGGRYTLQRAPARVAA
ncbi:ferredoxin-NADPH reductase [Pseudoclavibacter sp. AY1F1]|uniref:ferredoxin-NADPH reductase n=1 Tax=Pseudoclavibacter sp. AY1F1 TaxID=2080583 RepID=UPI000CE86081|nr:ferredoxin-NADPH reductase [Pseudoclavibacter sp. AY1F1]PPF43633.1 ferredoxin-NADPH reductase [Pseudoclavibacter sp. AY1F1]